ncbi:MAG: M24 family metallopeptidase [Salinirussus sp.]
MDADLAGLDDHLAERDVDGYLLDADGDDADQYYLSGFHAPDPFLTLYDGGVHLLFARSLEIGRARRESRAESVERATEFGLDELREDYGPHAARHRTIARFLDAHDVSSVAVPPRFPVGTADGLRGQNIGVRPDDEGVLRELRATKTPEEIEWIRDAQAANQIAMGRAEDLLAAARVDDEGRLHHEGTVLTSEQVRQEIEIALLEEGCALSETIVAGGADAADPHERGSGALHAGEAIIIDIFPMDTSTRYHGDLTRTFCVGDPTETLREWYALTADAKAAALDTIEPGVTGEAVHNAACEVYEDAGLPTLRSESDTETGFIHSTGHGVGLEVHELPRLAPDAGELEPGHVVTVEPGLYDPAVGGIRLEDLVVVTENGYENLTDYPEEIEPAPDRSGT